MRLASIRNVNSYTVMQAIYTDLCQRERIDTSLTVLVQPAGGCLISRKFGVRQARLGN